MNKYPGNLREATSLMLKANSVGVLDASSVILSASTLPVLSAFVAYAHYIGLFLVVASLVVERLTLCKEDHSEDDFDLGTNADIVYGLSGTIILVSGYYRATQFGKGWELYAHEPIFWVKVRAGDLSSILSTRFVCPIINHPPLSPSLPRRCFYLA